jgi:hypothetical protein
MNAFPAQTHGGDPSMKSYSFCSILLVSVLASLCGAQTTNQGSIVGTVRDPSGAVMPAVHVTVTNVDTHVTREVVSDHEGGYVLDFLQPGTYEIQAEMQGFEKTALTGVRLTVGELLRVDLKMIVGSTKQTVTVSDTAGTLNTETAAIGDVISSQAIDNLPLNGREFIGLAALVSGASSGNPKIGAVYSRGYSIAFNGARASYNNYFVDGAESTDPYDGSLKSSPPLDSIKEFRVETSMYSAQYGHSGGAIISAVTNSGTNKFRGDLYEYLRNKSLDALPYFFTNPRSQEAGYLFNQYGATLGGPIRKNKTFFFVTFERFDEKKPSNLIVSQAPTALERMGDFSQSVNQYDGLPVILRNPYTGAPIPGNVLPASLISPVGKFLMSLQPQPNFFDPANPLANLHLFRGSTFTQRKYLGRIDHSFNGSNQISASYDYNYYNSGSASYDPYSDSIGQNHNQDWTASYTRIFKTTLVNDLHFTYSLYAAGSLPAIADKNYAPVWGVSTDLQNANGAPGIDIYGKEGYYSGGAAIYTHNDKTLIFSDNLVWAKGRHTLLFGGDFRHQFFGWINGAGTATYAFGFLDGASAYAQYQSYYGYTGSPYGDLLAGIPDYVTAGLGRGVDMPLARKTFSGYVQDNWKVSPRLNLSLGLRWDYDAPFAMENGDYMTFDYRTNTVQYAKGAPASLLAGLKYPYETNGPNRPYTPSLKNFAPRIGFAFRPFENEKTVIRGGYGMFFISQPADLTTLGSYAFPFQAASGYIYTKAPPGVPQVATSVYTIDQPTPGLNTIFGQNPGFYTFISPKFPLSYIENYNLSVGRDLGHRTVAEVSFVGSRGVNLSGEISTDEFSQSLVNALEAKMNGWGSQAMHEEGFSSFYDGLQATLRKDMSNGIFFLGTYTWSHAIADSSNDANNEQLTASIINSFGALAFRKVRSNADFDVPQRFTFSGGWQLPLGRGKRFGGGWNRYVNGVLGGWQGNAIVTFQSGFPFSVRNATGLDPNRICNGNLPKSQRTLDVWYNASCFVNPPFVTVTDPVTGVQSQVELPGNAGANIIGGPGTNNWDLGVEKFFPINESTRLQFRTEFFNAFNHPSFIGPSGTWFYTYDTSIKNVGSARDIQVALKLFF